MKLTERQKHMLTFTLGGAVLMNLCFAVAMFSVSWGSGGIQIHALNSPALALRAFAMISALGVVVGCLMGSLTLPRTPRAQVFLETLRTGVLAHLSQCDPRTREMIQLYEWAGRAGWQAVEATVRAYPEKYPHAASLLARDAEILEFRKPA